jgi:hypothetical protein
MECKKGCDEFNLLEKKGLTRGQLQNYLKEKFSDAIKASSDGADQEKTNDKRQQQTIVNKLITTLMSLFCTQKVNEPKMRGLRFAFIGVTCGYTIEEKESSKDYILR